MIKEKAIVTVAVIVNSNSNSNTNSNSNSSSSSNNNNNNDEPRTAQQFFNIESGASDHLNTESGGVHSTLNSKDHYGTGPSRYDRF